MYEDYIYPQEGGARADVRWLRLQNAARSCQLVAFPGRRASGTGAAEAIFEAVNVSPYSVHSIDAASHGKDLECDGRVHVHLDHRHIGVGGDDSWSPSVHDEYLVRPGCHEFSVILKLMDTGGEKETPEGPLYAGSAYRTDSRPKTVAPRGAGCNWHARLNI